MVEKRVESQGSIYEKLTKAETDILHLLTREFLTVNQISIRRQTSNKAVYKIIAKIKKKGFLSDKNKRVENFQSTFQPFNQIRLHGQEFNIQILYISDLYRKIYNKSNILYIDGNTIRLYKKSIEIYGTQSFYAEDVRKATSDSLRYWQKFFTKLENQLKIVLIKPRTQNIRIVNAHYSETNNELAEEVERKKEKIKIYTKDDGKLWFLIDNSFNLHEAETVHPQTSKPDMETIKEHFNDIRANNPPTLSQVMQIIKDMAEQNKETAAGLNAMARILIPKKENNISKDKPDYMG